MSRSTEDQKTCKEGDCTGHKYCLKKKTRLEWRKYKWEELNIFRMYQTKSELRICNNVDLNFLYSVLSPDGCHVLGLSVRKVAL